MNAPRRTHEHDTLTATKRVVCVLQDLVARDRFATYADLAEALKTACRHLKIPYDSTLVSDAIDRLERGGQDPIVRFARPVSSSLSGPTSSQGGPSRHEARDLLAQIYTHTGVAPAIKTLAAVQVPPDRDDVAQAEQAARERAWDMGVEL